MSFPDFLFDVEGFTEAVENASTDEERDEIILRAWTRGQVEPKEPCTIVQDVLSGNTFHKTFGSKYLVELIAHIAKCPTCYEYYVKWFTPPTTEECEQ